MMMKTGILLRPLLIISILFNIQICADVIDLTDATFELDTKASSGTSSWFLLFKGLELNYIKSYRSNFIRIKRSIFLG